MIHDDEDQKHCGIDGFHIFRNPRAFMELSVDQVRVARKRNTRYWRVLCKDYIRTKSVSKKGVNLSNFYLARQAWADDRSKMSHYFIIKGVRILLGVHIWNHCEKCIQSSTNMPWRGVSNNTWHDQEECVGCRRCCFWDIGKSSVQIPLFYIVFSIDKSFITL